MKRVLLLWIIVCSFEFLHAQTLVPILWDNGSSGSGRESSGLFDRSNGEIYSHAKTIVDAAIKAATTEYSEIELP